jgi:hypothetical protein
VCFNDPDKKLDMIRKKDKEDKHRKALEEFLLALALSHTVVVDKEGT